MEGALKVFRNNLRRLPIPSRRRHVIKLTVAFRWERERVKDDEEERLTK